MKFIYNSVSKVGLKRKNNEDAVGVFSVDDGILTIVCDGLGGNKGGEVASNSSVDIIYKSFKKSDKQDCLLRIKESIEKANEAILIQSVSDPEVSGMATTVEVLFIKESVIYWGHVGDSRIYDLKNGRLKQITKDHSLVQQLVDEGHLTMVEAETHPNKNVIVRALGDSESIEIDLSKLKLNHADDHKFLVCTDGVSGILNADDLQRILREKSINEASQRLISSVESKGAPDNFSFVLLARN